MILRYVGKNRSSGSLISRFMDTLLNNNLSWLRAHNLGLLDGGLSYNIRAFNSLIVNFFLDSFMGNIISHVSLTLSSHILDR